MDRRIAPSVAIVAAIEAALTGGLTDRLGLSTLGRLGAQLVPQRAVENEVGVFLQRAATSGRAATHEPILRP